MKSLLSLTFQGKHAPMLSRHFGYAFVGVAAVYFISALLMAGFLTGATAAGGDVMARATYMAANTFLVQLGWACNIGGSLAILLLFYLLSRLLSPDFELTLQFSYILAIIGTLSACLAAVISLGILPDLSLRLLAATQPALKISLLEQFHTWDRFAILCRETLGNMALGLAGCIVTYVFYRSGELNLPLRLVALLLWGFTFWMSYGSFTLGPIALPYAVVSTMALLTAWSLTIGLGLVVNSAK